MRYTYLMLALWRACFAALLLSGGNAQAAGAYVTLDLPGRVSVEIPRNWTVLSESQKVTLDAFVQAKTEERKKAAGDDSISRLGFAANYYDEASKVASLFNVRYIAGQTVTQKELQSYTAAEMSEVNELLRPELTAGVEMVGNKVLSWQPARLTVVDGLAAILVDYRRSSPQGGAFRVRILRVLDGPESFSVTMGYRESSDKLLLEAIADRVLRTVKRR